MKHYLALRSVTDHAAQALGRSDQHGLLAVGRHADLYYGKSIRWPILLTGAA
jgi:imidazolonepropionase-like amidohydrolase